MGQAERAHKHTHPDTRARMGRGRQNLNHTRAPHTPARIGRRSQIPYPNTHALYPNQDWRGYRRTQTGTEAPHNSTKPSVHSPDTEAARAMQVTRLNEIRSPGKSLHPKDFAALGQRAERATPKHFGTQVPRKPRWHFLGTRYARKSGGPLGFCPTEGTCVSKRAHPPSLTSPSRWCCSGLLCWEPGGRSSGM